MTARRCNYVGRNAHGSWVGGMAGIDDVARFVESRFDAGWSVLRVFEHPTGTTLGAILLSDRRRTWWAETNPTGPELARFRRGQDPGPAFPILAIVACSEPQDA